MKRKTFIKLLMIAFLLSPLFYSCEQESQESQKHVDMEHGDKIFTSKEQLGGYKVIRTVMVEIETSWNFEVKKFYLLIADAKNTKEKRRLVRVTEDLWLNCDEGEIFPLVVERER